MLVRLGRVLARLAEDDLPAGDQHLVAPIHLEQERVGVKIEADPERTSDLPAKYLNRLSDLLFILSRVANPGGDVKWVPGGGGSED